VIPAFAGWIISVDRPQFSSFSPSRLLRALPVQKVVSKLFNADFRYYRLPTLTAARDLASGFVGE
jgi:hypothetical protein